MIFRLVHDQARARAVRAIDEAPHGWIVRLSEPTRTLDQNARMWAMLNDVAQQVEWYGVKMTAEDWKHVFSASLKGQKSVPGIDGGFVVLGQHTSRMTKRELSDLMELIAAFGAEQDVRWTNETARSD